MGVVATCSQNWKEASGIITEPTKIREAEKSDFLKFTITWIFYSNNNSNSNSMQQIKIEMMKMYHPVVTSQMCRKVMKGQEEFSARLRNKIRNYSTKCFYSSYENQDGNISSIKKSLVMTGTYVKCFQKRTILLNYLSERKTLNIGFHTILKYFFFSLYFPTYFVNIRSIPVEILLLFFFYLWMLVICLVRFMDEDPS